jgi:hypothetical protein
MLYQRAQKKEREQSLESISAKQMRQSEQMLQSADS